MEEIIFTRRELYDALWKEPMNALIKKYRTNYPDLKKICEKMQIPIPENGYWSKIKFSKDFKVIPFVTEFEGVDKITFLVKKEGETKLNQSPKSILAIENENDKKLIIKIPKQLLNPEKIVLIAKEKLNDSDYLNNGLRETRGSLKIKVSPKNISRALIFMDIFLKNIKARGHSVNAQYYETEIIIYGEKFKISFREKLKRTPIVSSSSWQQYDWSPTGILIFSVEICYPIKEWKDGKILLEDQMASIIAWLELKAKIMIEEDLIRQKNQAIYNEKLEIEREIERKKQSEILQFKELILNAERWQQANIIRSFINHLESTAITTNKMTNELNSWIKWARNKTEEHDPSYSVLK